MTSRSARGYGDLLPCNAPKLATGEIGWHPEVNPKDPGASHKLRRRGNGYPLLIRIHGIGRFRMGAGRAGGFGSAVDPRCLLLDGRTGGTLYRIRSGL